MLVLYSQLKKYLPELNADVNEISQVFTFTGQMIDKIVEVEYAGQKDYLLDLEVRQNRADCFGVIGLARELSAYYNISLKLPKSEFMNRSGFNKEVVLPIEIKATNAVKRVMAVKLGNINVKESPEWLREYLTLYGINTINNIVDLTNYVLIETGFPSHVFDTDLVGEKLVWEINPDYKTITTLNGDEVDLTRSEDNLVISDGSRPLSLSFIGGKVDAVNDSTKNVILEMGVYDGGLVRRNSRRLNIITESSQRLEKYIDPDMVPMAFSMLVELIAEYCSATVESQVYDNYTHPSKKENIAIRVEKISQLAGIEIPYETSLQILESLGFEIIEKTTEKIIVNRPINRLDISLEEDCIEEIIRIYGYTKIPKDELFIEVTKDITPPQLNLIDLILNILEANGYDEVRSWVLVEEDSNKKNNFEEWESIRVTNSINEEVPFLRQSLGVSLFGQLETYKKNNISNIEIFEIGKVFGKKGIEYAEHYSLGILRGDTDINSLKDTIEKVIRFFEVNDVIYIPASKTPETAHPKAAWNIHIKRNDGFENIGIIYMSNKINSPECVITEIDLDKFSNIVLGKSIRSVHEITQKLVELDTNIMVETTENLNEVIINKLQSVDNIWSWKVVDIYNENGKKKVTIRVTYRDMTDQEAKELHLKLFS